MVWGARESRKKCIKKVKEMKKICVCYKQICIFQVLFKNKVFRSVGLVAKKVMGYFRFFFRKPDFFPPCTLPYKLKKILHFYSILNILTLNIYTQA